MIKRVLIILITLLVIYRSFNLNPGMTRVMTGSGRTYEVRKDKSQESAELINELYSKLRKLVKRILKGKEDKFTKYVKRIDRRIDMVTIRETEQDSPYTSYSVNKGEELVFCLRSKKTGKFHDINELLYVGIHEIAHIGSPEHGHTKLFRDINVYLLEKAVEYGLYKIVDYRKKPKEYCGIELSTNILL